MMVEAVLVSVCITLWVVLLALIVGEAVMGTRFGRRLGAWYYDHLTRPLERSWEWLVRVLRNRGRRS